MQYWQCKISISPLSHVPYVNPKPYCSVVLLPVAFAGCRFFLVGQHARPSDSTDSSKSSTCFSGLLASENAKRKHPSPDSGASMVQQQHLQLQAQSLAVNAVPDLLGNQAWSALQQQVLGSAVCSSQADAPSPFAQNSLTDAPTNGPIHAQSLNAASGFDDLASCATGDAWATDCPTEDVEQLLNWAADPSLQSSASETMTDPADLSMPCVPANNDGLQNLHGLQAAVEQLSCSWETQATDLGAHSCFPDLGEEADSYPDDFAYSQLPALEAFAEAASQQPTASSEMVAGVSEQNTELSGNVLDQLMHRECCSMPESIGDLSDAVTPLSGRDSQLTCAQSYQACPDAFGHRANSEDPNAPPKKRCGRPRVYDLDTPAATGTKA